MTDLLNRVLVNTRVFLKKYVSPPEVDQYKKCNQQAETEKDNDRQMDRQTETEKDNDRHTDRETDRKVISRSLLTLMTGERKRELPVKVIKYRCSRHVFMAT